MKSILFDETGQLKIASPGFISIVKNLARGRIGVDSLKKIVTEKGGVAYRLGKEDIPLVEKDFLKYILPNKNSRAEKENTVQYLWKGVPNSRHKLLSEKSLAAQKGEGSISLQNPGKTFFGYFSGAKDYLPHTVNDPLNPDYGLLFRVPISRLNDVNIVDRGIMESISSLKKDTFPRFVTEIHYPGFDTMMKMIPKGTNRSTVFPGKAYPVIWQEEIQRLKDGIIRRAKSRLSTQTSA